VRCPHFDSGACRSCTLLDLPRPRQLAEGRARVEQLLAAHLAPGTVWAAPIVGPEAGFRARGKMAVGGTAAAPVLTLPGQSAGTDLCDCPLYPAGVEQILEGAKALIRRAQVPPYDVARRRGEIKNVLVTASPEGEHLLRLVLRSERALDRLREHLPRLLEDHPSLVAITANIHPEHTTAVEGEREIHLAGAASIAVRTGDVTLFARPQSFLQTNTEVAGQLYRQAATWVGELAAASGTVRSPDHGAGPGATDDAGQGAGQDADPGAGPGSLHGAGRSGALRLWDLYCGLGGFALHLARALPDAQITGVEVSPQAIEGAREAATAAGVTNTTFLADDATTWAIAEADGPAGPPDIAVVNPPRRGLGRELAGWLERSGVQDVIYSSCNPSTLATDLAAMPSLHVVDGRYVDMFPHTAHAEVIVRLRRRHPATART